MECICGLKVKPNLESHQSLLDWLVEYCLSIIKLLSSYEAIANR